MSVLSFNLLLVISLSLFILRISASFFFISYRAIFLALSSASFSALSAAGQLLTANYQSFGALTLGTRLDFHPTAWSGSAAGSVTFIYKGGLDGSGRP